MPPSSSDWPWCKDRWGRDSCRPDVPIHNVVVHIIEFDEHGDDFCHEQVVAEAPGAAPHEKVRCGILPGEMVVWEYDSDWRRESYTGRGTVVWDWNIWCIRECDCGCWDRKDAFRAANQLIWEAWHNDKICPDCSGEIPEGPSGAMSARYVAGSGGDDRLLCAACFRRRCLFQRAREQWESL
jgi:hypothetical protein